MYHVLVAEDEHWVRSGIVEMIERIGEKFKVVGEADNGLEAWNLIQELSPTVLITDIMMPKLDGLALLEQLHEMRYPIVSIIVSGYDNFTYAQQAIRYGVSEYLLKPVRREALREALQRSVDRLELLSPAHEQLLAIQTFLTQLRTMDVDRVPAELGNLLKTITTNRKCHPGFQAGLLRILAGRLKDLLDYYDPDGRSAREADGAAPSEEALIRRIRELTEQWCRLVKSPQDRRSVRLVIKKACDYAAKHYMEEISLTQIAAYVGLSVSHFSALFKQHTNESFVHYLNRIRIDKAKELLLEPDLKIYQVAELVGFDTIPYFNRVFKTITGLSPNEYRKEMGL
jgi:two-component system response regulator YesN